MIIQILYNKNILTSGCHDTEPSQSVFLCIVFYWFNHFPYHRANAITMIKVHLSNLNFLLSLQPFSLSQSRYHEGLSVVPDKSSTSMNLKISLSLFFAASFMCRNS